MKFYLLLALICINVCYGQTGIPPGYRSAGSITITGDFDGDGNTDTLRQFVTDSLGNTVDHIIQLNDEDHPIVLSDRYGYANRFTLNGNTTEIEWGVGIYCLINLGNINKTKGDEIAIVSVNLDYSNLNHCTIYSYCKGKWVRVFSFGINENTFDYDSETEPIFTSIPGALEKHDGKWIYLDYYEWMEMEKSKMKPLKVSVCK